eukprot:530518-Hanusia_phi.AAC.1
MKSRIAISCLLRAPCNLQGRGGPWTIIGDCPGSSRSSARCQHGEGRRYPQGRGERPWGDAERHSVVHTRSLQEAWSVRGRF